MKAARFGFAYPGTRNGPPPLEQKRVDEIASEHSRHRPADADPRTGDGARFVLVEGLHHLEAAIALGIVEARKH
jgi:hypothetical protein